MFKNAAAEFVYYRTYSRWVDSLMLKLFPNAWKALKNS